jgi:UDP-glucose 4-epimerase
MLRILELFEWISVMIGSPVHFQCVDDRPGDQMIFISDDALSTQLAEWVPRTFLVEALSDLWAQV